MAQTGIDALIWALAPAFAAGFAIQQLLELIDSIFIEPFIVNPIISNRFQSSIDTTQQEAETAAKEYANLRMAAMAMDSRDPKRSDSIEKVANAEVEKAKKEREAAAKKEEKNDSKKELKGLILGLASLIAAFIIVWTTNISVLTPFAEKIPHIPNSVDIAVTVLFISAGTEGINSIVKYLGYSKEKKDEEAKEARTNP